MKIRTFYWHDRIISRQSLLLKKMKRKNVHLYFKYGNAGDVFTKDIIHNQYGVKCRNDRNHGNRLLIVGSVGHSILSNDILCGIGVKHKETPKYQPGCKILGLRGPISYDSFKKAGYDLSNIQFLMDPGLLLRFYANNINSKSPKGMIFIPHYRERSLYSHSKLPKGIKYVDIDNSPSYIAKKIMAAELVFSSSLHGVIFSHALNRPCVIINPQTEEPMLKYQDYYESVNLAMPKPLSSISDVNFFKLPESPPDLKYCQNDFIFPSIDSLKENNTYT